MAGPESRQLIVNAVPMEIADALSDAPGLAAAFARIARGDAIIMQDDLVAVETDAVIDGTLTRTHCYIIGTDGNDWLRTDLLVETICAAIVEYAIPRSKIQEAARQCIEKKWQGPIIALGKEAKDLFTHLEQSGEGGELLLFCLSEFVLRFPQVLAKMHLKTAADVHYHGADGVHASVDEQTGKLCLWWGESKLHKTVAGAIRSCVKSLAPFLIEPASSTAKRNRDLNLLRYHVDLDDTSLEAAIKSYLDVKDKNYRKLKFGGLALIGFDEAAYPHHPAKADATAIAKEVLESCKKWRVGLANRVSHHQLDEIDMHVFLVPFPSVEQFRKRVRKSLGLETAGSSK